MDDRFLSLGQFHEWIEALFEEAIETCDLSCVNHVRAYIEMKLDEYVQEKYNVTAYEFIEDFVNDKLYLEPPDYFNERRCDQHAVSNALLIVQDHELGLCD